MTVSILIGDCVERMKALADNSVDAVVCDPPYHLTSIVKRFGAENAAPAKVGATGAYARASKGFMGQTWDGGDVAFQVETWAEALRVLKPGGHLIAFSGTRTYHRMAVAIEDAGFEIRDQLAWAYGSGFPKSHDVAQSIEKLETTGKSRRPDRDLGGLPRNRFSGSVEGSLIANTGGKLPLSTEAAREWEGWGTALKPAWEPICLARKPLSEKNIAANVLKWGTGALNIDGCRIEGEPWQPHTATGLASEKFFTKGEAKEIEKRPHDLGRWPANICHDGSDEVVARFPQADVGGGTYQRKPDEGRNTYGAFTGAETVSYGDSGSAARFFYCAKTSSEERGEGNNHPTVKPVALMEWLVRLVTPKGGLVLDPFMGSGSTGLACQRQQFRFIGCELSPDYAAIAAERMRRDAGMFADVRVEGLAA
jgi:DNA modification methylase